MKDTDLNVRLWAVLLTINACLFAFGMVNNMPPTVAIVGPTSEQIDLTCINESGNDLTVSEDIMLICKTKPSA